jgi:hypothetical protein
MTTQERIEKIESELSELKALALKEKEEKEFKVGDWVIIIDYSADTSCPTHTNGDTGIIKSINKVDAKVEVAGKGTANYGDYAGSSFGKRFRKATEKEIKTHLISEAEKKGFVKGAKTDSGIIESLSIYKNLGPADRSNRTHKYAAIHGENFIVATGEWFCLPIEELKLLPSTPSIEKCGYKGEFEEVCLNFNNCARFDKQLFIDLSKIFKYKYSNSNREIISIKIGKADFTAQEVIEIANHFTK